jgi:hypothetical protein
MMPDKQIAALKLQFARQLYDRYLEQQGSGVLADTIDGCVFAVTANTLAGRTIVVGCSAISSSSVPESGSAGLVSLGGLLGLVAWRRFRGHA